MKLPSSKMERHEPPTGEMGIPYNVVWEGIWQNGTVTETKYTFNT